MESISQLPKNIRKHLSNEAYETDHTGMSDSSVLLFQDKILKIQKNTLEAETEYRMMQWLKGRLPVPQVYAHEIQGDVSYLLMSRCPGEMACAKKYISDPDLLTDRLAQGLKKLWEVDISGCPADWRLKRKLEQAQFNVEHGLVDIENTEPGTFGEGGFAGPKELLDWLYGNQPQEEPVLSHGDFCLPNLLFDEATAWYIDLGRAGIADKWCDIALCYRSLSHNYDGVYGDQHREGLDDLLLFRKLGLAPDWEKIRYYILLDELF